MLTMDPHDEFTESLWQAMYDSSWPWSKWFINRARKRGGLPPLRSS